MIFARFRCAPIAYVIDMIGVRPRAAVLLLLSGMAVAAPVVPAVAQEPVAQPVLRSSAAEISIGGRVQTQLNTTSVGSQPPSQLLVRRARLELSVRITDRITGAIQPDFGGGQVELKDAYARFDVSPALSLLAGNAHRPFGVLDQTSSKRMPTVERGLRIRGLAAADDYGFINGLDYSDRDVGVQVLGAPRRAPLGFAYAAGVFRGPLHGQVGNQDSYQLAARVSARLIPALRLGAGWSSRDFAEGDGPVEGAPELRRGHAFEVDVEYGSFAPGLHVMAQVTRGDVDPFADATFLGAHAWAAYRTGALGQTVHALEPMFRASHADSEAGTGLPGAPGGTLLTPGLNLYLTPLNRVMLNYDIWLGSDDFPDAHSLKVMLQLAF